MSAGAARGGDLQSKYDPYPLTRRISPVSVELRASATLCACPCFFPAAAETNPRGGAGTAQNERGAQRTGERAEAREHNSAARKPPRGSGARRSPEGGGGWGNPRGLARTRSSGARSGLSATKGSAEQSKGKARTRGGTAARATAASGGT